MPAAGNGKGTPYGAGLPTPGYDLDALAYVQASGAASESLVTISEFVRGVKKLGLWNSMVCWPLRSSQNAGSGTTAYSLGGLGTFNGTINGGATWSADGVVFDGINDYIFTNLEANDYTSGLSQLVVMNAATDTQGFSMFFGEEVPATGAHVCMIRRNSTNNSVQTRTDFTGSTGGATATQNMTFGQWNLVHSRVVAPSVFISVNATAETSASSTGTFAPTFPNNDRIGFGARNKLSSIELYAKMTCSFGAFWGAGTSASLMQSVKTLYKDTLGQGLSLP